MSAAGSLASTSADNLSEWVHEVIATHSKPMHCFINDFHVPAVPVYSLLGALAATTGITGCACGQDHVTVPVENGVELVCRVHKRHIPCRRCEED